jgi:hypothetical protein
MFSQALEELQIEVEREVMARGGIKKGFEYRFPCPMPDHPDENPSANYNSEKGVWLCRSCSSSGGLLRGRNPLCELLGIETRSQTSPQKINITPTAPKPAPKPTVLQAAAPNPAPKPTPRKVVKRWRWDIHDVGGNYLATHHRIDYDDGRKEMPWSINGKPGLNGLKTTQMLYGCERLREREPGDDTRVYLCEGEKSVDALRGSLGVMVVGTVCGAASTPDLETLRCLEARHICLWPDNDPEGYAHMERIAALLEGVAGSVTIWKPASVTGKGEDAADWCVARR